MRVVVDTNVLVSGIFFSGPPLRILEAWRDRRLQIVASPGIVEEYARVGERLAKQFGTEPLDPVLALLATEAVLVEAGPLPEAVTTDPDDEKFLACAVAAECKVIVSGDKHLLAVSGHLGIDVLRPRAFVSKYLP